METKLAVAEEAEETVQGKELFDETLFPLFMQHIKR